MFGPFIKPTGPPYRLRMTLIDYPVRSKSSDPASWEGKWVESFHTLHNRIILRHYIAKSIGSSAFTRI